MVQKKKDIRKAVLDAAVELISSTGSAQLTLDAVAAKAAVSKGGLLHHFRSKEALLVALIERVTQDYDEGVHTTLGALRGNGEPAPHRLQLETYLRRIFGGFGKGRRDAAAVLAVAAHRPQLLAPVRDYFRRRSEQIHAELEPRQASATMAMLTLADGLWLLDALDLAPYDKTDRAQALEAVLRWIGVEFGCDTGHDAATPTATPVTAH